MNSTDNIRDEIEIIAETIEGSIAKMRPALLFVEVNAGGAARAISIIRDEINELAEQAAWLRKFAQEDEQYEPTKDEQPPAPRPAA